MIDGRLCEHEWQELRDVRTSPLFFGLPSIESDVAARIKTKTQGDPFKTKTHKVRPSLFFGLTSLDSDEPDQTRVHGAPFDCSRWTELGIRHFLAQAGF
jgi:hypothetical protein